jgi:hypothetical protein
MKAGAFTAEAQSYAEKSNDGWGALLPRSFLQNFFALRNSAFSAPLR